MKMFERSLTRRHVEPSVRGTKNAEESARFVRCAISCIAIVLFAIFVFFGCQPVDEETGNLNGTWFFGSDPFYKINTTAKTIEYVDNYQGNIINSPDFTAANGVLIIEFTKYFEWDYSDWPNSVSVENPDNIGKFGALYWTELKLNSVRLADYWDENFSHVLFDELTEAVEFFKIEKLVGISWSGIAPYTK